MVPFERPRTRMLAVVSVSLFLSVLVWFNYSAVLPLIVADWGISGTRAGIVFAAFQAGYLAAIVPVGMLVDRRSPRWSIAVGATVTGGASLAFGLFATGFLSGTLLRLVAGVGMAGVYVPGMRFVAEWYPETARGTAMGVYVGTFSASSGLSFLLAGSVAAALDWRTAVVATSVGALCVAPLVLVAGHDAPDAERTGGGVDLAVLRNRPYLAAVGVYSWHNWELFGMRNWLPAFLIAAPALAATRSPELLAGTLVGVAVALGGPGNLLGGALSDRVGRLRVVAVALATSGLISATLGLLDWLSLPALVALVFVYGVAVTMDSAPTSTAITEIVAPERIGTALSIQSFVGFSTTVVSPVVFGWALDAGGYALAFPTLAVGALAGLVCVGALRYTSRGART
ncbi:MFS transporter [Halalkalicoccus sp. NIPERK01]|uniref:MFS transporter n=1 Tax=Halalkalicoccus sp. NIPERK01 TaxID=3053469 RepID=UPI00256EB409|nr:MFS transporter [Halalkalicoccus sp. NIPERK01]MDL5361816.1 MFS transporter [Halalkalicoccus sp. NIPERK01]